MTYNKNSKIARKRKERAKNRLKQGKTLINLPLGRKESRIAKFRDFEDKSQTNLIEDIIKSEDRVKGTLSLKIIKIWMRMLGGSFFFIVLFLVLAVLTLSSSGIPWFLQAFATNKTIEHWAYWRQALYFSFFYTLIASSRTLCRFLRLHMIFRGNVRMSLKINFKMTFRVIHASVNKYFDRIPVGRLLNRFLGDVDEVDNQLPLIINEFLYIM